MMRLKPRQSRQSVKCLFALILPLLAQSCGDAPLGSGIGLPSLVERSGQLTQGLSIQRIFAPVAQSNGFVELGYNGTETLDLTQNPLLLQSASGSVTLSTGTWAPNSVLKVTGLAFAALNLHANAGELALFDSQLSLSAYGAWGNDPAASHSSLAGLAAAAHLDTAPRLLPYPLAHDQAILLDPARPQSACCDSNLTAAAPVQAQACRSDLAQAALWLSRVVPQGTDPAGSAFEIYNPTAQTLDVWGVLVCQSRAGCQPLVSENGASTLLAPGQTLATGSLDAGRRRVAMVDGTALSASDLVTDLPPLLSHDALALAPPGGDLTAAWSYVQLGRLDAAQALSPTRVGADVVEAWNQNPRPAPRVPGETLALVTQAPGSPNSPLAWRLSALGWGTVLSDPAAPYDACSAPQNPAPASVIIDQIIPWSADGGTMVVLKNVQSSGVSTNALSLALGSAVFGLSAAPSLSSQTSLWVLLTPHACQSAGTDADVCIEVGSNPLGASELSLLNNTALVAHMQWGTLATTSIRGTDAVAQGVWPAINCRIAHTPDYAASRRLLRISGASGQSPQDYLSSHLEPHASAF